MTDVWKWELIAEHGSLTEGPTWDGGALLYNECYAATTFRWDPKTGESAVWRTDTNQANGMKFDRSGRLFACEGGVIESSRSMFRIRVLTRRLSLTVSMVRA